MGIIGPGMSQDEAEARTDKGGEAVRPQRRRPRGRNSNHDSRIRRPRRTRRTERHARDQQTSPPNWRPTASTSSTSRSGNRTSTRPKISNRPPRTRWTPATRVHLDPRHPGPARGAGREAPRRRPHPVRGPERRRHARRQAGPLRDLPDPHRRRDEVALLDPAWVSYEAMVKLAGGSARPRRHRRPRLPLEGALDDLTETVSDDTELLVVNSPGNPTAPSTQTMRSKRFATWPSTTI